MTKRKQPTPEQELRSAGFLDIVNFGNTFSGWPYTGGTRTAGGMAVNATFFREEWSVAIEYVDGAVTGPFMLTMDVTARGRTLRTALSRAKKAFARNKTRAFGRALSSQNWLFDKLEVPA